MVRLWELLQETHSCGKVTENGSRHHSVDPCVCDDFRAQQEEELGH